MSAHSIIAAEQKTISINRVFNLPLYKVWKAWSEPEYFIKWWGPEGFSCPYCTIDFKIGGRFLNAMRNPDGTDVWGTGTYTDIVPQHKIVYTDSFADSTGKIVESTFYKMPEMPLELLVTVTLEEVDGKTQMWLQHEGIPEEMYEDCIKGWQSSFNKLEEHII
ncbi:SRPBCC family protein [Ferruginibacter sp.]